MLQQPLRVPRLNSLSEQLLNPFGRPAASDFMPPSPMQHRHAHGAFFITLLGNLHEWSVAPDKDKPQTEILSPLGSSGAMSSGVRLFFLEPTAVRRTLPRPMRLVEWSSALHVAVLETRT